MFCICGLSGSCLIIVCGDSSPLPSSLLFLLLWVTSFPETVLIRQFAMISSGLFHSVCLPVSFKIFVNPPPSLFLRCTNIRCTIHISCCFPLLHQHTLPGARESALVIFLSLMVRLHHTLPLPCPLGISYSFSRSPHLDLIVEHFPGGS